MIASSPWLAPPARSVSRCLSALTPHTRPADRRARADGGEIRLAAVGAGVARVVALTGVDRVVAVYASLEEALT